MINMASEYNSNFESEIVVNPCKNCPASPPKPYAEVTSSPQRLINAEHATEAIEKDEKAYMSEVSYDEFKMKQMPDEPSI